MSIHAQELTDWYKRLAPLVHARAKRLVGDQADDVVQEVFEKLLRSALGSHWDVDEITAWIYRISTNACLDRLRYLRRRHTGWVSELRDTLHTSARSTEERFASLEMCRKLLQDTDYQTQQIVVLSYFDEMTQEEVARVLGVSRKTVNERLKRFGVKAAEWVAVWQS